MYVYVFVWFVGILSFSKSYDLGLITVFMVVVSVALCLFFTCFFQIFSLKWRDYLQDLCVFFCVGVCIWGALFAICSNFLSNLRLRIFPLFNFTNCYVYFVCLLILGCGFFLFCFILFSLVY